MGNRFSTRDFTLDEANNEQETMFKKIEDLKLRAHPKKVKVKTKNKKYMEEVIKTAEDLYEIRIQIINLLEGVDPEPKRFSLGWLHRPKKELEDLIKKIEDDEDLDGEDRTKIMKKNLLKFLDDIMTGKINNRKDAKDYYSKNIFDYKKALTKGKIDPGSRTQRMRGFIETDKGAEYIIFGTLVFFRNKTRK